MKTISPSELKKKISNEDEIVILDVRAIEKYSKDHIDATNVHSINIPKSTIFQLQETKETSILELPVDKEIIVTCTTGNSARKCASILSEYHYQVTVLDGGMTAWNANHDDVESD